MFLLNGKPLPLDTPWTHPETGTQYPANWLRLSSADDKAALGITEAADPEPYDQRYYWGPGNPKDLAKLKRQAIREVKAQARALIGETDWQVTRHVEKGEGVAEPLRLQRQGFRDLSDTLESGINACTTVEELIAAPKSMHTGGPVTEE